MAILRPAQPRPENNRIERVPIAPMSSAPKQTTTTSKGAQPTKSGVNTTKPTTRATSKVTKPKSKLKSIFRELRRRRSQLPTSAQIINGTQTSSAELAKNKFVNITDLGALNRKPATTSSNTTNTNSSITTPIDTTTTTTNTNITSPTSSNGRSSITEASAPKIQYIKRVDKSSHAHVMRVCLKNWKHDPQYPPEKAEEARRQLFASSPTALFEKSLRALQGFDFGEVLNLPAALQITYVDAFRFNRINTYMNATNNNHTDRITKPNHNKPDGGDKEREAVRLATEKDLHSFLDELTHACLQRAGEYMNKKYCESPRAEDRELFFFGTILRDMLRKHSLDKAWTQTYRMFNMSAREMRELMHLVLSARMNYVCKNYNTSAIDEETVLTCMVDKWTYIWRQRVEFD